jgi:hypothetical protein
MNQKIIYNMYSSFKIHIIFKIPSILFFILLLNILSYGSCGGNKQLPHLDNSITNNQHGNQSSVTSIEECIEAARPNHEITWCNNKNEGFIEYYLTGQNNECAFAAFGTTRQEAIKKLRETINSPAAHHHRFIRDLIARAIEYDSQNSQLIRTIFKEIPDRYSFKEANIQNRYLDYYAQPGKMIECAVNYNANGDRLPDELIHYTLLDALAYLYQQQLIVYGKTETGHNLIRLHQLAIEPKYPPIKYLVLSNSHFNRLVRSNQEVERQQALAEENIHLSRLRQNIEQAQHSDNLTSLSKSSFELDLNEVSEFNTPTQAEEVVEQMHPNHKIIWRNDKNKEFVEYYLNRQNNDCVFYAFGTTRKEAIKKLHETIYYDSEKHHINIKRIIAQAIKYDKHQGKEIAIFGRNLARGFSDALNIQRCYLDYYAHPDRIIECTGDYDEDGNRLNNKNFTLLDALAYLYQTNLIVYLKKETERRLIPFREFIIRSKSPLPIKYLVLSGSHFNKLVPNNQEVEKQQALLEEEAYLSYLNQSIEQSKLPSSFIQTTTAEEDEIEDENELQNGSHSQALSSNSTSQSITTFTFTEKELQKFLNTTYKRIILSGCTSYQDSQKKAYKYLQVKERGYNNNALLQMATIQARAKLIFEHKFKLPTQERETIIINLRDAIQHFITNHHNNANKAFRLLTNYGWIYIGKAERLLGNLQQAYEAFTKVDGGYTHAGNLDLAEMMVDDEFIPPNLGEQSIEEYIQGLLYVKGNINTESRSIKRKADSSRTEEDDLDETQSDYQYARRIAHPIYRNAKKSKTRENRVRKRASRKEAYNQATARRDSTTQTTARVEQHINSSTVQPSNIVNSAVSNNQEESSTTGDISEIEYEQPRRNSETTFSTFNSGKNSFRKRNSITNQEGEPNRKKARIESSLSPLSTPPLSGSETEEELNENSNIQGADIDQFVEEIRSWIEPPKKLKECRTLIVKGKSSRYGQAHFYYLEALELAQELDAPILQAEALIGLGDAQYNGHGKTRIDWYFDALKIIRENRDNRLRSQIYIGLGNARHIDIKHPYKYSWYLAALKIAQKIGDNKLTVRALIGLANVKYTDETHPQYYSWYFDALKIVEKNEDNKLRAQIYIGLGNAQYKRDGKTSTDWYVNALKIVEKYEYTKLKAQVYIGLGNVHYNKRGKIQKDWYLDALKALEEDGDDKLKAQAYIGLGNAQYNGHDGKTRIDWYLDALKIVERNGDNKLKTQVYIGLGNVQYKRDGKTSIDWYLNALKLLEKDGDDKLKAQAYIGLGNAQYNGHGKTEIDWLLDALKIVERNGDDKLKAQAYIGLGNARYIDETHLYNCNWYLEALDILKENKDDNLKVQALIGLGNVRYTDETHSHNYTWYLEALDILKENKDDKLKVQVLIGLDNSKGPVANRR